MNASNYICAVVIRVVSPQFSLFFLSHHQFPLAHRVEKVSRGLLLGTSSSLCLRVW